jgi:anti-sigma28 factor (negative regulator of flagellin synthesis)
MDKTLDSDADLVSDQDPATVAGPPQPTGELQASEATGAGECVEPSLRVVDAGERHSAPISEAREAKLHHLQQAIANDTYHVTPEQIAEKLLRRVLQEDRAQVLPARPVTDTSIE